MGHDLLGVPRSGLGTHQDSRSGWNSEAHTPAAGPTRDSLQNNLLAASREAAQWLAKSERKEGRRDPGTNLICAFVTRGAGMINHPRLHPRRVMPDRPIAP